MKKHPVDDLFNRRLSGLEKKPTSDAWARIQAGTGKKERRLAAWVWYAAASVALALITGYAVWENENSYVQPPGAGVAIAGNTKTRNEVSSTVPVEPTKADRVKGPEVAIHERPSRQVRSSDTHSERPATEQPGTAVDEKILEKAELPVVAKIAAADVNKKDTEVNVIAVQQVDVPQTAIAHVEKEKAENRTILVQVEMPDEESAERSKPSRFIKVFRQLKNARAGERVDWEEVGLNPKRVVARVDERLREGEDKVSEKYQIIKDRTKL